MGNQKIKCNVSTCKHFDSKNLCTLDSILVGNTNTEARLRQETECDSFEC